MAALLRHINCRNYYYYIIIITFEALLLARSLTPDATATYIHSFITARLDYCCSQFGGCGAWTGFCVLQHASLDASPDLPISPATRWMCSTGSPPTEEPVLRASLWSGGYCWVSLRLSFEAPAALS